jgi:hypothetical protein
MGVVGGVFIDLLGTCHFGAGSVSGLNMIVYFWFNVLRNPTYIQNAMIRKFIFDFYSTIMLILS